MLPPKHERCGQPLPVALARIGTGAVRRRLLSGHACVRLAGHRVVIDLDNPVGLHTYRHGWCDVTGEAIAQMAGPGGIVVDGGANVGLFSLVAAAIVGPTGVVHAVEAAPATATILRRHAALNPELRIEVVEAALAESEGELEFTTFEPGSGYSSFAPEGQGEVTKVRATTLDALTEPLERVDVVKLDLEGAELRALQGARRLLAEQRPALVVELEPDHLARQGGSIEGVERLMTEAGYAAHAMVRHGDVISLEPLARPWRRPAGEPNIALLPEERG